MRNKSAKEHRKPIDQDVELVKNNIERCILKYMNKKETMNTLNVHSKIGPWITQLVWERLEEENPEFFKAYYIKLKVKDQIMEFNRLLAEQVELMNRSALSEIIPDLSSNGYNMFSREQIPPLTADLSNIKREDISHLHEFQDYGLSIPSYLQEPFDLPPHTFLSQNPSVGLTQTMNGQIVRIPGYAAPLPLSFNPSGSFLDSHHLMGDASLPPFDIMDSANDSVFDVVPTCFLGHSQQTFSPDFGADFSSGSELTNDYIPTDGSNFTNSHGDLNGLDHASANSRRSSFGH